VQKEDILVPILMGFIYTALTLVLLVLSVGLFRGINQGLLAGITLLSYPNLIIFGASQCADVPLGFYYLSAIVLLVLALSSKGGHCWFLVALSSGLAAWTKNEGIVFALSMFLLLLLCNLRIDRKPTLITLAWIAAGFLIPGGALLLFKVRLSAENDVLSTLSMSLLQQKLFYWPRYQQILCQFGQELFKFPYCRINPIPFLFLYGFIVGSSLNRRYLRGIVASGLAIALVSLGYFFVYVVTPHDLHWHLDWSLKRLILQLWPSVLFLIFIAIAPPEQLRFRTRFRQEVCKSLRRLPHLVLSLF
jgi:hypothetical protein